jgi:hypothetical protein
MNCVSFETFALVSVFALVLGLTLGGLVVHGLWRDAMERYQRRMRTAGGAR